MWFGRLEIIADRKYIRVRTSMGRLASATNKQGHLTGVRVMSKKKKQDVLLFFFQVSNRSSVLNLEIHSLPYRYWLLYG